MISKYIIYGLVDPRTDELRYVGKSSSGFNRPRQRHSAYCACWIKGLFDESGLRPDIIILKQFDDSLESLHETMNTAERDFIAVFRAIGCRLTNLTDGGDGIFNPSEELRKKFRDAKLGKKLSEEHKRKIALGHMGKIMSEETKEKIRIANRFHGKKHSFETKEKMSRSQKLRIRSDEIGKKIAASLGHRIKSETDGLEFVSIGAAARHYNISTCCVVKALRDERCTRKGLRFIKI